MADLWNQPVGQPMLVAADQPLTAYQRDRLWDLFCVIADTWGSPRSADAERYSPRTADMRSSWEDFINARVNDPPSYSAEYSNAVEVMDALDERGRSATDLVLPESSPDLTSRLGHAKAFVVDEFITVWVTAGGFRAYAGFNHNGYLAGSRFNMATRGITPSSAPVELRSP